MVIVVQPLVTQETGVRLWFRVTVISIYVASLTTVYSVTEWYCSFCCGKDWYFSPFQLVPFRSRLHLREHLPHWYAWKTHLQRKKVHIYLEHRQLGSHHRLSYPLQLSPHCRGDLSRGGGCVRALPAYLPGYLTAYLTGWGDKSQ